MRLLKHVPEIRRCETSLHVNALATRFVATTFIPTLSTYICRLISPPVLPVLPNVVDRFDVHIQLTILQPSNSAAGFPKSVDRLRAKGRSKAVPAHFDTVLVRVADSDENQHTKVTCLEGACFVNYC